MPTHWFSKPPSASCFEPAEMTTKRSRAKHCEGVLLELLKRYRFPHGNLCIINHINAAKFMHMTDRIIICINGEQGNSDSEKWITRRRISIVCTLCGKAPSWALKNPRSRSAYGLHYGRERSPVKFEQISYLSNSFYIHSGIFGDLFNVPRMRD